VAKDKIVTNLGEFHSDIWMMKWDCSAGCRKTPTPPFDLRSFAVT
jgi:hypothetical protein